MSATGAALRAAPAILSANSIPAPEHCWVKFSDSPKTDLIIGEPEK